MHYFVEFIVNIDFINLQQNRKDKAGGFIMLSLPKADRLAVELKNELHFLPVAHLAKQSGFVKRKPRKVGPMAFVLGFFLTALSGNGSLKSQASHTGLVSGCKVSKQAIDKRIKSPLLKFLELLLAVSLSFNIKKQNKVLYHDALSKFNRILVEDSTHIHLPSHLAKFYPGSKNATRKENATLKIRTTIDLLSERFEHFYLSPFTQNDQSASADIISRLQPGDLVMRDLGYFVLPGFMEIARANAYFISPLKHGVNLHEADGETKFNLLKKLKKYDFLDTNIFLGAKEKLPCRLIAIPVAEKVAAERRRQYKANRDRRLNPSKEHLALLGWDIFITNVASKCITAKQIAKLYDLRWRIEIIFKSWKSCFNITNVPNANVIRVQAYIYAMLIFITIFQVHIFLKLYQENLEINKTQLSLLKGAQFFKEHIWALVLTFLKPDGLELIKEQIFYHCKYESRTDRLNYPQKVLALG